MGKQLRLWLWGLSLVLGWGAVMSAAGQEMMVKRHDVDKRADSVICGTLEPGDTNYYYCALEHSGRVQLVPQWTNAPCIYNRTWGYDRGGVWVKNGCRAEFVASGGGGREREPPRWSERDSEPRERPHRRDGGRIVTCSSQDKEYAYCAVRIRDNVQLRRQLSSAPCRLGRSWGYDAGGIWVDHGCRAEFVVP